MTSRSNFNRSKATQEKQDSEEARMMRALSLIGRTPDTLLPKQMRRTLKYVTQFSLDAGVTIPATKLFLLNSLFAPESGGHQPMGFDNLAALYHLYWVVGVAMKVSFFLPTATADIGSAAQNRGVGMLLTAPRDSTANASVYGAAENHNCVWAHVGSYGRNTVLKGSYDVAESFGISRKQLLADNTYGAVVTASPSNVLYAQVMFGSSQQGSDTQVTGCDVMVEIEFDSIFTSPPLLGTS
jgi:hypothetical protein